MILADEHGRFNGFPEEQIESYHESLIQILDNDLFQTMKLSDIWRVHDITREKIESIFQHRGTQVLHDVDALHRKQ